MLGTLGCTRSKSERFVLLLQKPVLHPHLKGCLQFWYPGGWSRFKEQLETIKVLELLPYGQTHKAAVLQAVEEKAQGKQN